MGVTNVVIDVSLDLIRVSNLLVGETIVVIKVFRRLVFEVVFTPIEMETKDPLRHKGVSIPSMILLP